jgi:hypothetical protein
MTARVTSNDPSHKTVPPSAVHKIGVDGDKKDNNRQWHTAACIVHERTETDVDACDESAEQR